MIATSISTKLYCAVGTLAVTGMFVSGAGIWSQQKLVAELSEATSKTAVKLDLVNATRARSWEMIASLRAAFVSATVNLPSGVETASKRWQAASKRSKEQIAQIRPLIVTEQGRRDIDAYQAALERFEVVSTTYLQMCREHRTSEFIAMTSKIQEFSDEAERTLNAIRDTQRTLLADSQQRAETVRSRTWVINAISGVALLAIAFIAAITVR